MRVNNFRLVGISLLIGSLLSFGLTYWELEPIIIYMEDPAMLPLSALFISWFCKLIAITMMILAIFLIGGKIKEYRKEGVKIKVGEKAGIFLQILSIPVILLTAGGVLPNYILTGTGIFLLGFGLFHSFRLKNRLGGPFIIGGIALIVSAISIPLSVQSEMRWVGVFQLIQWC